MADNKAQSMNPCDGCLKNNPPLRCSDCTPVYDNETYKQTIGKLPWHLLIWDGLKELVRVREFVSKKYPDPESWKQVDRVAYCDAAMRHLVAYMGGETYDPESGLHHLAHMMCNGMFIVAMDEEQK